MNKIEKLKLKKEQWGEVKNERKMFGNLIKQHRKKLGMNQTEYASFIGVGRFFTVSSYELGNREAPYRIIFKILKELGLKLEVKDLESR